MHIETTFTQYCLVIVMNKLTYKQSRLSAVNLYTLHYLMVMSSLSLMN